MTPRIPDERIEEWERIAEKDAAELASDDYDENDMEEFMLSSTEREFNATAREALPALLSERESLLAENRKTLEAYESLVRDVKRTEDPGSLARLRAERESLLSLLREVEWAGLECDSNPACPVCYELEPGPHKPDCRLAAFLKET